MSSRNLVHEFLRPSRSPSKTSRSPCRHNRNSSIPLPHHNCHNSTSTHTSLVLSCILHNPSRPRSHHFTNALLPRLSSQSLHARSTRPLRLRYRLPETRYNNWFRNHNTHPQHLSHTSKNPRPSRETKAFPCRTRSTRIPLHPTILHTTKHKHPLNP